MWRPARALLRDGFKRDGKVSVRKLKPKGLGENIAIFSLFVEGSPLNLAGRLPHIEPRVEQCNSGPTRSGTRCNQITAVRAVGMTGREPVANLVLGIHSRQPYNAIDVLPAIAQSGLQRQFVT